MAVNPALIPKELTNVYAPEGYDANSSILACNFPTGTSVEECSNFMAWIGPVVYVEEGPSLQREANFLVVFSAPEFAVKATQEELIFNEGCRVHCRAVDARPTVWGNITNFIQGVDQQYGASDQISAFINDTAGTFVFSCDRVCSGLEMGLWLGSFLSGARKPIPESVLFKGRYSAIPRPSHSRGPILGPRAHEWDLFHP
ncbi:hypothetical protein OJ253_2866 [Cryptosporidium canis]|uniref:Uncharacterized protein n=1 Tax=Cryptosporidium canis TaxID=195482 RepID=A0A9D5DKW5_9CRYT|nr:hypothetical protein OJ253_2866 [Cryptosporidium canis]